MLFLSLSTTLLFTFFHTSVLAAESFICSSPSNPVTPLDSNIAETIPTFRISFYFTASVAFSTFQSSSFVLFDLKDTYIELGVQRGRDCSVHFCLRSDFNRDHFCHCWGDLHWDRINRKSKFSVCFFALHHKINSPLSDSNNVYEHREPFKAFRRDK